MSGVTSGSQLGAPVEQLVVLAGVEADHALDDIGQAAGLAIADQHPGTGVDRRVQQLGLGPPGVVGHDDAVGARDADEQLEVAVGVQRPDRRPDRPASVIASSSPAARAAPAPPARRTSGGWRRTRRRPAPRRAARPAALVLEACTCRPPSATVASGSAGARAVPASPSTAMSNDRAVGDARRPARRSCAARRRAPSTRQARRAGVDGEPRPVAGDGHGDDARRAARVGVALGEGQSPAAAVTSCRACSSIQLVRAGERP